MKVKQIGLLFCAVLIITAGILQWQAAYGGFYHQHKEETDTSVVKAEEIASGDWEVRQVSSRDFLLRNYVFCNLSGDLCGKAPVTKYALKESGEVVQLSQKVPVALGDEAEYIVCLAPENDATVQGTELNTLAIYRHLVKSGRNIKLIAPSDADEAETEAIRAELSYFEKTLYSYDFDSSDYGYDRFVDTESFIRYLLVTELAGPEDAEKIRYCLYKNRDGKYALCVADFLDSAMDPETEFRLPSALWYTMLLKDLRFTESVINEYRNLRDGKLSEESLSGYIDEASAFLDQNYGYASGNRQEAEELKTYLELRLAWMDANIESLYQYSSKSAIKNYTDDPY